MAELNNDLEIELSKPWQKFLAKFEEIKDLPVSQWKEVHILGYICQKYKAMYGKRFALSLRKAPSKCEEIYAVKRIYIMLNTTSSPLVKTYIDWVYKEKIRPKQIKFRVIGFFANPNFVNEFNLSRNAEPIIDKTTPLPTHFLQVAETLHLPVTTYGDLSFIKMALDQNPEEDSMKNYQSLFKSLTVLGLDLKILENLV